MKTALSLRIKSQTVILSTILELRLWNTLSTYYSYTGEETSKQACKVIDSVAELEDNLWLLW